jgi:hypothetical protein
VGWVVFASITMITLGAIEVMIAMVAFFNKAYYSVASTALAVHINYTGWGIIQLLFGLLLIAAGCWPGRPGRGPWPSSWRSSVLWPTWPSSRPTRGGR